METPSFGGGLLSRVTLVAMPEYLYVLEHDFGSDRLRRVPYADVKEVMCGKLWSWILPVVFLALLAWGLIELAGGSPRGVVLLACAGVFLVIIVVTGGKTVFIVETALKTIKVSALFTTKRKTAAFLAAVLDHVARDQEQPPDPLGRSVGETRGFSERRSAPPPDVVEAEAVEVVESGVPLHKD